MRNYMNLIALIAFLEIVAEYRIWGQWEKASPFERKFARKQLKREFGDDYEQLYGVCLRKFDYDAGRAAEYIRKNQLTSKLLAAKMQLSDYDITPEEYR